MDESDTKPLPRAVLDEHGPLPDPPGRRDWKVLLVVGSVFLAFATALVYLGPKLQTSDVDLITVVTMPALAGTICLLYALWKLATLTDRSAREERALGFITIFMLAPLNMQFLFLPVIVVLALRRNTQRPEALGQFSKGVGMGCLMMFLLLFIGMAPGSQQWLFALIVGFYLFVLLLSSL